MDAEQIKREAVDARDAQEDAAVVSPPPLDALWHADLWASAALDEPLGRFLLTDADALALTTRSDSSDAFPPAPAVDSDLAPREDEQAKQAAVAARRRRAYRVKKKSELETLREASAVLGDRLAALVAKNEALKDRLAEYGRAGRFAAGWRGVALRQLQRRLQAEALNRELRALVRQHRQVGHTLVCSLQSQVAAAAPAPARRDVLEVPTPQRPKEAVHLLESDARTAAEFLREVDATYHQAHDVLRSCQPPPVTGEAYSSRQSWRRDPQTKREFFEFVEAWTIPFSLEDAVPAMHMALPIVLGKECRPAVIPVPDAADTTAIKFVFSCSDSEQRVTRYQCLLVAKVFAEKDHAVFRWRAVTVEVDSVSDEIVETGWGVAQRARSASGRQDEPTGTDINFYTRFEMREDALKVQDGCQRNKQLEKYVRSLFSDVQEDVSEWYQVIESLVMKDLSALRIT